MGPTDTSSPEFGVESLMQIGPRFCHVSNFKHQNTPFQAKNSVSGNGSSPSGVPPRPILCGRGIPLHSHLSTPSESAHAFSQNSSQIYAYMNVRSHRWKTEDLRLYGAYGYANVNRGLVRFHSDTTSYVTPLWMYDDDDDDNPPFTQLSDF